LIPVIAAPLCLASAGCGAVSELRVPATDAAPSLPDVAQVDAAGPMCPWTQQLSTGRRIAWSTCNNPNREESCVISTDGTRVCGCSAADTVQEQCGFSLVNFIGSTPVLGRALCDSRTGICQCTIGNESCTCRSTSPGAACAIRTGRNCCWVESL
jgi:hypothetical protein